MSHRELSQAEIDALFERYTDQPLSEDFDKLLSPQQLDTIGEVGNIVMGTAATTLSQILNQRVNIGNPRVIICKQEEVFKSFAAPYLLVYVSFKLGLNGFNVLIITKEEVAIIANLMMGGDGNVPPDIELSEIEISAAQEAMNQMIGSACTAMTEMFGTAIDINPPKTTMVHDLLNANLSPLPTEQPVVVARFETFIGDILKTTIMQIISVDAAQEEANYLLKQAGYVDNEAKLDEAEKVDTSSIITTEPVNTARTTTEQVVASASITMIKPSGLHNLTGALSLPVQLTLALGKIPTTVEELAKLQVGKKLTVPFSSDNIEIYAGDTLVGRGKLAHNNGTMQLEITQLHTSHWKMEL